MSEQTLFYIMLSLFTILSTGGVIFFVVVSSVPSWEKRRKKHLERVDELEPVDTVSENDRKRLEKVYRVELPVDCKDIYEVTGYFYGVHTLGNGRYQSSSQEYILRENVDGGWYYFDDVEVDVASVKYLKEYIPLYRFLTNPNRNSVDPVTIRFVLKKSDMGTPLALVLSVNEYSIFDQKWSNYPQQSTGTMSASVGSLSETHRRISELDIDSGDLTDFLLNEFCDSRFVVCTTDDKSIDSALKIGEENFLVLYSNENSFTKIASNYPEYIYLIEVTGREVIDTFPESDIIINPEYDSEFIMEKSLLDELYR